MTKQLNYGDVQGEFEPDGSLRDLYVFETSVDDWVKFLELAVVGNWPTQVTVNGENTVETQDAVKALGDDEITASCSIQVGAITLNCHFFASDEIELDMEPAQINEQGFEQLCQFLQELSVALRRSVFVTHESSPEYGIIVYDFEAERFRALHRPKETGPLAKTIAAQVAAALEPFEHCGGLPGVFPKVPTNDASRSAARHWRDKVYRPGCIDWHTELTSDEYRSLRELDTALCIFFGPRGVDDLVSIGGFNARILKQQFWEAVRCVRARFAL